MRFFTDCLSMATPYIPNRDSLFGPWLLNFSTLLTANPGLYGLVAADATAVAALNTSWIAAYALVTSSATKTAATVQAKNINRLTATATLRSYAQRIAINPGVLAANKIAIGVNARTNPPTPIAAPVTFPVISIPQLQTHSFTLYARDNLASPSVKAKPAGAIGMQLFQRVGGSGTPSVNAGDTLMGTVTKIPTTINTAPTNAGSTCFYAARWITRTGLVGPMSAQISTVVT